MYSRDNPFISYINNLKFMKFKSNLTITWFKLGIMKVKNKKKIFGVLKKSISINSHGINFLFSADAI